MVFKLFLFISCCLIWTYTATAQNSEGMQDARRFSVSKAKPSKYTLQDEGLFLRIRIEDTLDYIIVNLYNNREDTAFIPAHERSFKMIQEALDSNGIWKPIEYRIYSGCGYESYPIDLPPRHYIFSKANKYTGDVKTKIRLRLDTGEKENPYIYSEPYEGFISYQQFGNPKDPIFWQELEYSFRRKKDRFGYYKAVFENPFSDTLSRSDAAYYLAYKCFANNKLDSAYLFIQATHKINPNFGEAYILLGNIIINSAKKCAASTNTPDYYFVCAAMEKWEKALSVNPQLKSEIDHLISKYSPYLPTKEMLFSSGKTNQEFGWIECWYVEKFRFRTRD